MGVGGLRWCAVRLAASLPIAPSAAHAEPAHAEPAHAEPAHAEPARPTLAEAPASPHSSPSSAPTADAGTPVGWALPRDAARRYSPFLNGLLGGMTVGQRFESDAYFGSELAAFFGPWRVSLRALFPFGVEQAT